MAKKDFTKTNEYKRLRKDAVNQLGKKVATLKERSGGDLEKVLHELSVHQIELEMQNEELRRAQQALESSRARYAELYDFAPLGYFTLDKDGRVTEANLTGCQMLGIERRNLIGKPFSLFVDKASQNEFYLHRQAALSPGLKQIYEITLVRRGKHEKFAAQLESVPVLDAGENVIHSRAVVIDVTKRMEAEEAIRQSEEKFRGLFTNMSEGSVLFDLIRDEGGKAVDCRILDANPAVEKMAGVAPSDAIGRTIREIFPDTDPFWFDTYGKVEATGEPAWFERRFEPLGRFFHTSVYRAAPGRVAIVFVDITERKQIEQELRESNAELNQFNRAMVGRELRMVELKKEINKLCESTGQPPRYSIEFTKGP